MNNPTYIIHSRGSKVEMGFRLLIGTLPVKLTQTTSSIQRSSSLSPSKPDPTFTKIPQYFLKQGSHYLQFEVTLGDGTTVKVPTSPIIVEVVGSATVMPSNTSVNYLYNASGSYTGSAVTTTEQYFKEATMIANKSVYVSKDTSIKEDSR